MAQVYLTASTTALTNQVNIWEERDFTGPGLGAIFGAQASIASASACDIGSPASNNVKITGTTMITSLGSSASAAAPIYVIQFAGALTLT